MVLDLAWRYQKLPYEGAYLFDGASHLVDSPAQLEIHASTSSLDSRHCQLA